MRVWTNAAVHVVLGPHGLSVERDGVASQILPPLSAEDGAYSLAVDPNGKTAHCMANGYRWVTVDLEEGAEPNFISGELVALAPLPGGSEVAAVYLERRGKQSSAKFRVGPMPAPGVIWTGELNLAKPTKFKWPAGLIWAEDEKLPWSRKSKVSVDPRDVRIVVNEHGTVLADSLSGIIALVRPGSQDLDFHGRVPLTDDGHVYACATDRGVLAVVDEPGGAGIGHFGPKGKYLGSAKLGSSGQPSLCELGVLVPSGRTVLCLSLDGLEPVADPISVAFDRPDDARADAKGRAFILARGPVGDDDDANAEQHGALLGLRQGDGSWAVHVLELPEDLTETELPDPEEEELVDPEKEARRAKKSGPLPLERNTTGEPHLTFDLNPRAKPWSFPAGGLFEIFAPFISTGGPEVGLFVELSGPGIESGVVDAKAVSIICEEDGKPVRVEFTGTKTKRAEFPGMNVPAGVIRDPSEKKRSKIHEHSPPDTKFVAHIEGTTAKAGSGLLLVRVGFLSHGQRGSVLRGKPIEVTG